MYFDIGQPAHKLNNEISRKDLSCGHSRQDCHCAFWVRAQPLGFTSFTGGSVESDGIWTRTKFLISFNCRDDFTEEVTREKVMAMYRRDLKSSIYMNRSLIIIRSTGPFTIRVYPVAVLVPSSYGRMPYTVRRTPSPRSSGKPNFT